MAIERSARATWTGDLRGGQGEFDLESSHTIEHEQVTYASRFEQPGGKTSPEELIAAAHSACFAMALSARLTQGGHPPEQLTVSALCTLDRVEGGYAITTMELDVRGRVPGIDEPAFLAAVGDAEKGCPVSKALSGNVAISATGHLES